MIPLSSNQPNPRLPLITWTLIGLNVLISVYVWTLPSADAFLTVLVGFGLIPSRLMDGLRVPGADTLPSMATLISHQFIHANLLHLFGNILYLKVFGEALEMRLGWGKYILFYLLGGVIAGVVHIASSTLNGDIFTPGIGASGAIAGVLGAYLALWPGKRVTGIVFLPIPIPMKLPTFLVLGWWFVQDYLAGLLAITPQNAAVLNDGVAYWAHVGGFIAGMVLAIPLVPSGGRKPDLNDNPFLSSKPLKQLPTTPPAKTADSAPLPWTPADLEALDRWIEQRGNQRAIEAGEQRQSR